MTEAPRDNLRGGAWLLADLSLNIWSLSLVKWLGADYAAAQVVFFRAIVGLMVISPLIWARRQQFRQIPRLPLHLLRVVLSAVTLSASFFAIARLPLAVFTAISFTRPIVTMLMAALILREVIGLRGWSAAAVAFVGILIAVDPGNVPLGWGLAAMAIVVLTASAVVIATRALRAAPPIVMMMFYTLGLSLCSLPFAWAAWAPVPTHHLGAFVLIGCFAQAAQFCFLRAHYFGAAGYLSVLSYTSLIFSVSVGYFLFGEVPGARFAPGAALVIAASLFVTLRARAGPDSG
ncbi:putative membrane protein [Candidatus Rhodobacter oscarellae]|uniref:Putative membrane protein n=1 Tax=Candidatus Rhodobacter oscarellae TaxID=1675527 RepID=A0A0J9H0W8_9RHOB|nr:DMT family transporter [Candidatus Rhodobacter lobularis]KMW59388.1 putative membrane protein [Candidatus Rhodobacter lobularis]